MHGRETDVGERSRYILPARTRGSMGTIADCSSVPTADSFCKDGRTICVGDCALFRPPKEFPPFIGIICWITVVGEIDLKLGVNWLYRPADVKFGKSILQECTPNEVLYSFHSDEILAASLLHPCKVAFLPKGVELPPGTSSFVCHRGHREEVDQLLHRTTIEMHTTVQPGGRSPKPIKSGSDNVLNTCTSFPSQVKRKKRERGHHGFKPIKRERSSKIDADIIQFTADRILKSKIVKITDRGGLVDVEGVEKLVQLMMTEKGDRKRDLASRSLLVKVIASSDKFDCLSWFVQLGGLPVLDEWLQEVHKGKIDDDKSVEEFILVLLHALNKLPVNLNALKTCNIGKSMNHLRTHKSLEIQKKSRSLVDLWKTRVKAEMKSNDVKSVMKSSLTHVSPSRSASGKDGQPTIAVGCVVSGPSQTKGREERSRSSIQSRNNSQSCSGDLAKTLGFQGKEDARISTDGSMSVNKSPSGASWQLKSVKRESGSINHKLVVKLLNQGQSPPAQSAMNSQVSSPVASNQHGPFGLSHLKGKSNSSLRTYISSDTNTESWQSDDFKDVRTGFDEGDRSPTVSPDDEQSRNGDEDKKMALLLKAASSASCGEPKSGKSHEDSFSSMYALIGSCVKYSEPNASMSVGNDAGINPLAGVAAGEMSKPDIVMPADPSVGKDDLCNLSKNALTNPGDGRTAFLSVVNVGRTQDSELKISCLENGVDNLEGEKKAVEGLLSHSSLKIEGDGREHKPPTAMINSESPAKPNEEAPLSSSSGKDLPLGILDEHKAENADEMGSRSHASQAEKQKIQQENNESPTHKNLDVDNKSERTEENVGNKEVLGHQLDRPDFETEPKSTGTEVEEEMEERASTNTDIASFSAAGVPEMDTKLEFDLNEGINVDNGECAKTIDSVPLGCSVAANPTTPLSFYVSSVSSTLRPSVTVAEAAKGPFLPPEDLLRGKGEFGWKGSAATSAFLPAEPRKVLEMHFKTTGGPVSYAAISMQARPPLDIDLNVLDERAFEDMGSRNFSEETVSATGTSICHEHFSPVLPSGGLDFDLNQADEATDIGQCLATNGHRLEVPLLSVKSPSGGYPNGEVGFRGNFVLKNGYGDGLNVEPYQFIRMNTAEAGNFSSWFPPGNTSSAVTNPFILPHRGESSFPVIATDGSPRRLGAYISGSPLGPDPYRGSVLSSSPVGSFPSTPFQYSFFPSGTSFPLSSATFPVNPTTRTYSSSNGNPK